MSLITDLEELMRDFENYYQKKKEKSFFRQK